MDDGVDEVFDVTRSLDDFTPVKHVPKRGTETQDQSVDQNRPRHHVVVQCPGGVSDKVDTMAFSFRNDTTLYYGPEQSRIQM